MKVVLAPDSFKGGPAAQRVAELLATGWASVRADDELVHRPVADGGEGTLDALAAAAPGARRHHVPAVTGPDGSPVDATFLLLPDALAAVELASSSGIGHLERLDPLGATTYGLGEVIAAALDAGARRLLIGVGGSASTDGGTGALRALGLRLEGRDGREVALGGAALADVAHLDTSGLRPAPPDGVRILTDVDNPLLGPRGAAATFGPQKGASPEQVEQLEAALARLASLAGGDPDRPGAGAAGGTAYGFATFWGAELASGSVEICAAAGVPEAVAQADLVVTGEGAYDATTPHGKAAGHVLQVAARHGVPVALVVGAFDDPPPDTVRAHVELTALAGSRERSLAEVERLLVDAGAELARQRL